MRYTPVRCTPARCTPIRCTPHETPAHKIHTYDMHAHEVHVYETHAYQMHAHQMHDRLTVTNRPRFGCDSQARTPNRKPGLRLINTRSLGQTPISTVSALAAARLMERP